MVLVITLREWPCLVCPHLQYQDMDIPILALPKVKAMMKLVTLTSKQKVPITVTMYVLQAVQTTAMVVVVIVAVVQGVMALVREEPINRMMVYR